MTASCIGACDGAIESPSTVSRILHLVSEMTDEVYGFLGPATRELSDMGRLQSIVLLDDDEARKHLHQLRRHADVVLVEKHKNKYVQYTEFYRACCRELLKTRPSLLHLHGIVPCVIGSLALRQCGLQAKVIYSPHGSRSMTMLRVAGWLTMAIARPLIRPAQSSAMGERLVVIGAGAGAALKRSAGPTVEFLGAVDDATMTRHFARCKALLYPGVEDFGIVPLEVMASGRPVIAFAGGGALETVIEGRTGLFFHEQTTDAMVDAIRRFDLIAPVFRADVLQAHARSFDIEICRTRMATLIDSLLSDEYTHVLS